MRKSNLSHAQYCMKAFILLCVIVIGVRPDIDSSETEQSEIDALIQEVLNSFEGNYGMHANALRNRLQHILENYDGSYINIPQTNEKHSAKCTSFEKRNLAAMARKGLLKVPGNRNSDMKRSLAILAKNGQLPSSTVPDADTADVTATTDWVMNDRRYIGSLPAESYNEKRNIATLARDYQLPNNGKRNVASVARTSGVRSSSSTPKRFITSYELTPDNEFYNPNSNNIVKRNVGSLARDWLLPKTTPKVIIKRETNANDNESVKNKSKRSIAYDPSSFPNLNNDMIDYYYTGDTTAPNYVNEEQLNELLNDLNNYYGNNVIHNDKRYLGRILPPTRATSATNRRRL